jgi:hypothetical protein
VAIGECESLGKMIRALIRSLQGKSSERRSAFAIRYSLLTGKRELPHERATAKPA